MRKITPLALTFISLLILSFGAQSQNKKLVFSNGQQTDIQGNATIDINTGDITVQPVGNKLIVDEPANQKAIIGFYPSEYAIKPNDTIDVNWAVAFTDGSNCTASVTQGAALWSGNKNAGPGVYVQPNVTVSQLPATLRLTCNNYNGGSSYQEFDLVQAQSEGGTTTNPVITTFQLTSYPGANPTIPSDGSYNIQWDVSDLTGSCTATTTALSHGGWNGTITNPVGNRNITIEGEPTLRLICSNGGTQVQRSITITNSGGGGGNPPGNCSQVDVWTPPGLTAVNYNYTHAYQGGLPLPKAIPGQNGFGADFYDQFNTSKQMINFINPEQQYLVISNMKVPTGNINRKFTFSPSPGWGEQGATTFSISKCPGNFNPATARCVGPILSNTIMLSTDNAVASGGWGAQPHFCHLEKGETYYINFVFAQPYNGTNKNNVLTGPGEECTSAVSGGCSIFWGEKGWDGK